SIPGGRRRLSGGRGGRNAVTAPSHKRRKTTRTPTQPDSTSSCRGDGGEANGGAPDDARHCCPFPTHPRVDPTVILLANSRQQSIGRNMGKMGFPGKGKPRFQAFKTNSPAVSTVTLVANSAEGVGNPGDPFAGGPILPRLRLGGPRREFAT